MAMKGNSAHLLQLLKSGQYDIKFGWLSKNKLARFDHRDKTISINLDLILARQVVHEHLHEEHPELSEDEIKREADAALDGMTVQEIVAIGNEIKKFLYTAPCTA